MTIAAGGGDAAHQRHHQHQHQPQHPAEAPTTAAFNVDDDDDDDDDFRRRRHHHHHVPVPPLPAPLAEALHIEGRHSVALNEDVCIDVAEDEPDAELPPGVVLSPDDDGGGAVATAAAAAAAAAAAEDGGSKHGALPITVVAPADWSAGGEDSGSGSPGQQQQHPHPPHPPHHGPGHHYHRELGWRGAAALHTRRYVAKLRGGLDHRLPLPRLADCVVSWLGCFVGILVVAATDQALWTQHDFHLLVASFGASAVLIYGLPESKLSQPRNLVGGHVVSATVGVCVRLALARVPLLAPPLGMSLAMLAMMLTSTTHPPGGATALIACTAPVAPWAGFQLVVAVAVGALELLAVALLVSNLHRGRSYPTFWY